MKQLGILDAAFVNLEQSNTPQHVGGMGIYDPSTAPGGFVRFKDVIASFERRLGNMPLYMAIFQGFSNAPRQCILHPPP